jgi:hypothetical protein
VPRRDHSVVLPADWRNWEFISVKLAARAMNSSESQVCKLIKEGRVSAIRNPGSLKLNIRVRSLLDYLSTPAPLIEMEDQARRMQRMREGAARMRQRRQVKAAISKAEREQKRLEERVQFGRVDVADLIARANAKLGKAEV